MESKECVKALVRGKTFPLGGAGGGGGAYTRCRGRRIIYRGKRGL